MKRACRNGHPWSEGSYYEKRRGDGIERVCRRCKHDEYERWKQRQASGLPAVPRGAGLEIWRMAVGFENWMAVSTWGRFRSLRSGHLLTPRKRPRGGNLVIRTWLFETMFQLSAPATILRTFIEREPAPGEVPVFLDGNTANLALVNLRWGKRVGNRRPAQPKPPPLKPLGESLRGSLSENAIYAAAAAAEPRNLPPHVRDDVISDLMVAVLSGELAQEDIAGAADSFRRAHNREFVRRDISLDDVDHEWRGYGAFDPREQESWS